MTTPSTNDCPLCIDGVMPAGIRDILGPVIKPCPTCAFTCHRCHGTAVFPAGQRCLDCFITDLATIHGLAPVFCPGCEGVLFLLRYQTREGTS